MAMHVWLDVAKTANFISLVLGMSTVWRCRHVRKAAVQLLSTAAHNKPGLILDHLPSVLPLLYQQTTLNPALVR
jgi:hypothetical protein